MTRVLTSLVLVTALAAPALAQEKKDPPPAPPAAPAPAPEAGAPAPDDDVAELAKTLALEPAQREALKKIIADAQSEFERRLVEATQGGNRDIAAMDKIGEEISKAVHEKILAVLKPEQRPAFEKWSREREEPHPAAPEGVAIDEVAPGSPLGPLGFKPGDVIVAVDGHPVDRSSMRAIYAALQAGGKHSIRIVRDGKEQTIELEPQELK